MKPLSLPLSSRTTRVTRRARPSRAFTMVEMLVAVAILTIMVLMVTQIVNSASQTITGSKKHMDAESQARLVFNRMADDFAGMLKRNDVDYVFYNSINNQNNDGLGSKMFFYSQAPAYFDTSGAGSSALYPSSSTSSDPKSPLSLLGYRVAKQTVNGTTRYQLQRLGKGLTWDNNNGNASYGSIAFLTWNPSGSPNMDLTSTLPGGAFSSLIGTPAAYYDDGQDPDPSNPKYQALGEQVFRMEFCFLLKDGTYSTQPVLFTPPASWPTGGQAFYSMLSSIPSSVPGAPAFAVGSRAAYLATGESFICTNAVSNAAVWSGLGVQDVQAIVVTLAILDAGSQQIVPAAKIPTIINALLPSTTSDLAPPSGPPTLPAQKWQAAITDPNFASSAGIPQMAAAQIRIYQRYFYLNQ